MTTVDENKTRTGLLGEKIVAKYYRDQGMKVDESLDLYDRKKDMTIDSETCEIKTQQLWYKENSFTVKENQIKKCSEVDKLIFVETPSKFNNFKVSIYEYPKNKRQTKVKLTSDNRKMHLYNKDNGILLTTITDDVIINQFKRYSVSSWS